MLKLWGIFAFTPLAPTYAGSGRPARQRSQVHGTSQRRRQSPLLPERSAPRPPGARSSAKLARTGDSEALFLLDWFHHHILLFWRPRKERTWRYTIRLAARVWCFMNGLGLAQRWRHPRRGKGEARRPDLSVRRCAGLLRATSGASDRLQARSGGKIPQPHSHPAQALSAGLVAGIPLRTRSPA